MVEFAASPRKMIDLVEEFIEKEKEQISKDEQRKYKAS